ncbi:MAG: HesA/MoeB/ThiF family protein [Legionella longbeachae]|nr:HesA/MoeB/ThiF family protein [Legionella longbeachae]
MLPEFKRYNQQIKLEEIGIDGQKKLQNARVLCIGAGGIAATLLSYLAAAGVGTIGIIDDDLIEEGNLHRQILYQEKHINKAKAEIAKKQLLALNSHINILTYEFRLTAENAEELITPYDFIADCTDNFYTRYLIHDTCFGMEKPYFYASAYQFQGHCSVFYGKHNPCLHCLFPIVPKTGANCQDDGVLGTLPGLLGLLQATEIIKWITQSGVSLLNRLLCINFLTMEMSHINLIKNDKCQFCVHGKLTADNVIDFCNSSFELNTFSVSAQIFPYFLQRNPDTLLLDVRTVEEHVAKNLGGKSIPLNELPSRLTELDSKQLILIYCQSGRRSQKAFMILRQAGFHSIYHLTKGIESL